MVDLLRVLFFCYGVEGDTSYIAKISAVYKHAVAEGHAEFVSEHPSGLRDAQAKSDLRLALTLCCDALGMDKPEVH